MDHLNGVHQSWEGVLDSLWCAFVKGFDELLKSSKVLNVILSFIELLSNFELNTSPFRCSKINFISGFAELFSWVLAGLSKNVIDGSAVLASELL